MGNKEDDESKVDSMKQTIQDLQTSLSELKDQVASNTNALNSYSDSLRGILFVKSATDECPPGSSEVVCWHWFDASRWDPYCGDNNNAAAGLCRQDQNKRWYNEMACCY